MLIGIVSVCILCTIACGVFFIYIFCRAELTRREANRWFDDKLAELDAELQEKLNILMSFSKSTSNVQSESLSYCIGDLSNGKVLIEFFDKARALDWINHIRSLPESTKYIKNIVKYGQGRCEHNSKNIRIWGWDD
jgi:hypothetical protein